MDVASAHLARIGGRSRLAGSTSIAEARVYCAGVLQAAGFTISEYSFEYSAFPGSWATPIAGVVASSSAIALFLGRHSTALLIAGIAALAAGLGAVSYLGRRGVLRFPYMRRRGVNLHAVREGAEPAAWLVAHIDSKWQPVSMIARVIGVVATAIGLILLLVLAFVPNWTNDAVAAVVLMLTWLATVPLMLSIVDDRNDGTLDNASGVAAVLEAAETISADSRVGILITDAEEFGLAGATAWVSSRAPGVAINCDSVDDQGELTVMYSGSRHAALVSRLTAAASAQGEPLRVMRLLPGILTDSVALDGAGWEAVTLSRGNVRTLRRIHTSRDTLAAMRGTGIASVARVLVRIATELG